MRHWHVLWALTRQILREPLLGGVGGRAEVGVSGVLFLAGGEQEGKGVSGRSHGSSGRSHGSKSNEEGEKGFVKRATSEEGVSLNVSHAISNDELGISGSRSSVVARGVLVSSV